MKDFYTEQIAFAEAQIARYTLLMNGIDTESSTYEYFFNARASWYGIVRQVKGYLECQ